MRRKILSSAVPFLLFVPIGCLGQAADSFAVWNDTGISRPAFSRIPYRETAGVIEILPGMWMKDLGAQGQWNPVRYRGGGFSQTVFLVNGFNFNDPWTGMPDWNFLPEAWLDSVKCHSAMNPFGVTPVGAVIDAATERELAQRPLTEIAYSKTGDGFSRTCASFSKAVSNRLTLRAAAAFRNYGESVIPPASDDVTVHGQARFRLSPDWRMEYFFGH
jgi:outer membrane cobalamin receptor